MDNAMKMEYCQVGTTLMIWTSNLEYLDLIEASDYMQAYSPSVSDYTKSSFDFYTVKSWLLIFLKSLKLIYRKNHGFLMVKIRLTWIY